MKRSVFLLTVLFLSCVVQAQVQAQAQSRTLTGTVLSSQDNRGIPFASVTIKGTNTGTTTDVNGKFSINAPSDASTIVFSSMGFKTQEQQINSRESLTIVLEASNTDLDAVVVTGYSTQRKADLTGAVSVVNVDDMKNVAENNPIKALQGRIAGMTISADGNPSGAASIRIRGIGTLNNNDPLFIIDGIPTKGGMHELNSNDIASIQVLKDAAAASIYGSRAANGVIIITTKKGEQGRVKVNFDSYITTSSYGKTIDMLNAKQYAEALYKANINGGVDPNMNALNILYNYSYDDNGNPVLNGITMPKYLDSPYGSNTLPTSNTDWFDAITRTGIMQSYNLSVSSATDKASSFFSIGYLDNQGTVQYTSFNRISARMNTEFNIGKYITVGENFSVNRTKETLMPGDVLGLAMIQLPLMPVKDINGDFSSVTPAMNDRQNPMRVLYDAKDNGYQFWRLFGNAFVDVQPIKNLHFRSNFGLDYGNLFERNLVHTYNGWLVANDIASSQMGQKHWMKWVFTNTVSYEKETGKHRFDALAGVEMVSSSDMDLSARREGYDVELPNYMWPNAGTGDQYAYGGATGAYSLLSYFVKGNYVYDNRYLFSATFRADGSSRFGKNNRFGFFPAVSGGWRLSNEKFMEGTKSWLSDLKLRVSWGQVGNQEISDYATYTLLLADYIGATGGGENTGTAYDINGNNSGDLPYGYMLQQLGNDDLKWETTTQINAGIDFGFLDHKLYGSFEWYKKITDDILIMPPYLAALGEGGYNYVNGASMENQGLELSLGYRNKTSFGLNWDITANISGYRNKITKLPESVILAYGGNGTTDVILGRAVNTMYGYRVLGLFLTQEEVDNYVDQTGKGIGRLKYENINGDGKIDGDDRTWIGSPHPDFEFGINIYLEYKGFDLTAFFQGIYGNMIYNNIKATTDFWSVNEPKMNKGTRLLDAYDPVTNPNSSIPALALQNTNDEGRTSTYFVEPGSYMKLRNLQFGYSLPKALLAKAKMSQVRFYVSGQNLFTVKSKKFTGLDPENPNLAYPLSKTVTFGVNIGF
jgi:TonB-linked SusC/RagA family outer membrane protein